MNKHMIYLAGLALAASLYAIPALAQPAIPAVKPIPVAGPLPPPHPKAHVKIETDDESNDDGPLNAAHAAVADAERNVRKIFGGDSQDRPLIISSSSLDEQALANLDEDMNIMARILDKSGDRGEDHDNKAMGIKLWAIGGGSRGARNLYLDGYGAVFIMNVNMPLLAPASKPAAEEKKESASSSWEEARKEIYGRDEDRVFKHGGDKKPGQPYDAERVEELQKDLTEALKNATHIRGLKENENVTIVIQGVGSERVHRARAMSPKGEFNGDVFAYAFSGNSGGPRSVMTLRAKKSDIDAFAKNQTDLDDFRKKVSVAVYQAAAPSSGGGEGGLRLRP
jgi:hypothetical protein